MDGFTPRREAIKNLLGYAATLVVCLAVMTWYFRLWRFDLAIPLLFYGDWLFTALQVQAVLESGWHLQHPRVGMPFGSDLLDVPIADGWHFALIKLYGAFGLNAFEVLNLHSLLTFPLTALTSYFAMRKLGGGRIASLAVAQLYTFQLYHVLRLIHPFLAAYYLLPLMTLVLVVLYRRPGLIFIRTNERRPRFDISWRMLGSIVLCAIVGMAGIYYAFFSCCLLVVVGVVCGIGQRRWHVTLSASLLAGVIAGSGVVNMLPYISHQREHGRDSYLSERENYLESEVYGLKLAPMLLPGSHHAPESFLGRYRLKYDHAQIENEQRYSAIGVLAAIGFLLLLVRLLTRRPLTNDPETDECLSVLTVSSMLLAAVGGFGTLVALIALPEIRCYNRMSIFVAFFALAALFLALEARMARWRSTKFGCIGCAFLLMLMVGGIREQISRGLLPPSESIRTQLASDAEFVRGIEETLPEGAMVFQLPYHPFPTSIPQGTMLDFDHLRGPLLSKHLRWSYGGSKGRLSDRWQAIVGRKAPAQMLDELVLAGFEGLYVDRNGYRDRGDMLNAELTCLLQQEALTSRDGRFLFFDLRPHRERSQQTIEPYEWDRTRAIATHVPMRVIWKEGFIGEEKSAIESWHWCIRRQVEIHIVNDTGTTRTAVVRMKLASHPAADTVLRVRSSFGDQAHRLTPDSRSEVQITGSFPPGRHVIHLESEGSFFKPANQARTVFFRVFDFEVVEAEATFVAPGTRN